MIPISHLIISEHDLCVPEAATLPTLGRSLPGKVSETYVAGHVLPSSGLLGVRWPSRPVGRTPPAFGSAA